MFDDLPAKLRFIHGTRYINYSKEKLINGTDPASLNFIRSEI